PERRAGERVRHVTGAQGLRQQQQHHEAAIHVDGRQTSGQGGHGRGRRAHRPSHHATLIMKTSSDGARKRSRVSRPKEKSPGWAWSWRRCVQTRYIVEPSRNSQRRTAFARSAFTLKSGTARRKDDAGPAPSG